MALVVIIERDGDATLQVSVDGQAKYKATASRAFIDEEIGEGANGPAVSLWFTERSDEVEQAIKDKHEGGDVKAPYDRLTVEGVI